MIAASRLYPRIVLAVAVLFLISEPGAAAEVQKLAITVRPGALKLSARLSDDAISNEIRARLDAGLEIAFEYSIQLRRLRRRYLDKTVSERYVVVTAQYSNLTKMYKMTCRLDGAVVGAELTDQSQAMETWMSQLNEVAVFDDRDLNSSGTYYVRVKAKLHHKFTLLFLPADIETDWTSSERFDLDNEK